LGKLAHLPSQVRIEAQPGTTGSLSFCVEPSGSLLSARAVRRQDVKMEKKLRSPTMLYSRLLSEISEDVRRSAREKVGAARSAIHEALNIVKRSQEAVEKAEKTVRNSASQREARAAKRPAAAKKLTRRS
jgi:uncharacterized protein YecA (UPF0149 family)